MLHDERGFLRRDSRVHGLAISAWLTLALAACSSSTVSAPASDTGGASGASGSASTSGTDFGGSGSDRGGDAPGVADPERAGPPRVVSLVHQNRRWEVMLDNTAGVYAMSCSASSPSLDEQNPPANAQPLPAFGDYYLDGKYSGCPMNAGCDVIGCEPFPSRINMLDVGYVSVGTLPHPGDSPCGTSALSPAFTSYERQPPLELTMRYFTDRACTHLVTPEPQVLTP